MKRLWGNPWFKGASIFGLGLVASLTWFLWPTPSAKEPISLSPPVIRSCTNGHELYQTVSFSVTNLGARALLFSVGWLECRDRNDLRLLTASHSAGWGQESWVSLKRGRTTTVTTYVPRGSLLNEDGLFCCFLYWQEKEPVWWAAARKLDPWLSQTLSLFAPIEWVPPWRAASAAPKRGEIFNSNVEVAEYFRLAYGFTRNRVLHETAQGYTARADGSAPRMYMTRPGQASSFQPKSTPQTIAERRARMAFVLYCSETSDVPPDSESVLEKHN